jgi:hypothetical protein
MIHLILTGTTGLVGASVLSHILSLPATSTPVIHKLLTVTRSTSIPWLSDKPSAGTPNINKHTKIEVIEHKEFSSYPPELLEKLNGADACIWSLSVSQNNVSTEQHTMIMKEYSTAAAKALASLTDGSEGPKFEFTYISGEGATLHVCP